MSKSVEETANENKLEAKDGGPSAMNKLPDVRVAHLFAACGHVRRVRTVEETASWFGNLVEYTFVQPIASDQSMAPAVLDNKFINKGENIFVVECQSQPPRQR